jgi:hypothetical protein
MGIEQSASRRRAIQTQRGRKTRKLGGTHQRFWASHQIGPPASDTRPPMARQPKGEYASVPDTVVDHRPPVSQKPLTACALRLLELYYKLNVFVTAIEENAPVEWAAEQILGLRKRRAYAILHEIRACTDLENWLRQRALAGMQSGRIRRGRETLRSPLADAFFIALAGGVPEARSCARCLAGAARADIQAAAPDDHDEAASEVHEYMVHSGLIWRLRQERG